jgi:hypothetical protein
MGEILEAADEEPQAGPERLELLAVIRGLEALEQRSRVTLVAPSPYLRRGLEIGLPQWREHDWQWERYGRLTPVKNRDLWQRLDRLLAIHAVECSPARLNRSDDLAPPPLARRTCRGRKLRFDLAGGKSEIRSTKSETNSKHKRRNDKNRLRLRPSSIRFWDLFRLSDLVLRALRYVTALNKL